MTSTGQANPISGSAGARVPNVAIIGMEGSGKTVLTTTLAKRLSTIDDRGVFLNPQGVNTLKYVERVWHTLQSGDWPPSTPPGELFELQWKLEIVGECACDLRLIDAAGQDLRFLFGDEQILSVDALPGHLQALAEYCRAADIIVFLINLKDFLGEANDEQRASNEAAIKSAMDYLARGSRPGRLGLLMTQWDQYRDMAEERGGWLDLVREAVPYVFSAHIRLRHIAVFRVSAVADTQVVVDPDGTARRVPVEGFHSEGIDDLVDWLKELVPQVQQELDQQAEAAEIPKANVLDALASEQPAVEGEARTMQQQLRGWITKQPYWRLILWVIVLASSITLVRGCLVKPPPPTPPKKLVRPDPKFVTKQHEDDPGIFDDGVKVWGTVRNAGAAGKVRVIAWITEKGRGVERQQEDFYLEPGQTADYFFQMNNIVDLKNKHEVYCRAEVP